MCSTNNGDIALVACAIEAPFLLHNEAGNAALLRCTVDVNGGKVELRDAGGRTVQCMACISRTVATTDQSSEYIAPSFLSLPTFLSPFARREVLRDWDGAEWRGEATAEVEPSTGTDLDEYSWHPAIADAATHLGAILDVGMGGQPRVPVGAGCYCPDEDDCFKGASRRNTMLCTASPAALEDDTIRTSSFHVGAHKIQRLRSKSLGHRGIKDSRRHGEYHHCPVYSAVEEVAAPGSAETGGAHLLHFNITPGFAATIKYEKTIPPVDAAEVVSAFGASCSILQCLENSGRRRPPPSVAMQTQSTVDCPVRLGVAATKGLFTVAYCENPAWELNESVNGRLNGPATLEARVAPAVLASGWAPQAWQQPLALSGSSCIISGGLNGLGSMTALWVVAVCGSIDSPSSSVCDLTLLSRGTTVQTALCIQDILRQTSIMVHIVRCDMGLRDEAESAVNASGTPAGSFIHAAGVLADGLLKRQTLGGLFTTLGPKLGGLRSFAESTWAHPMNQIQLFSSISALLGNPGQANYAAANAALDGAAAILCAQGVPAASVQWGPWSQAGMAARHDQLLKRLERQGFGSVFPESGLAVMASMLQDCAMGVCPSTLAAVPLRWNALMHSRGHLPVLKKYDNNKKSGVSPVRIVQAAETESTDAPRGVRLQQEDIEDKIGALVSAVLGTSLDPTQPLMEAGLDSLASVELQNSISSTFGVTLPATVTFDYPTTRQLAAFVSASGGRGAAGPLTFANRPSLPVHSGRGSATDTTNATTESLVHQVAAIVSQLLGLDIPKDQPLMEVNGALLFYFCESLEKILHAQ